MIGIVYAFLINKMYNKNIFEIVYKLTKKKSNK